mgnify:CR=1 FL=1
MGFYGPASERGDSLSVALAPGPREVVTTCYDGAVRIFDALGPRMRDAANLDAYAEKHPRLEKHLKDIKMSALIFPFKASPYLVEELIDWEMEGDIKDDPFYRLVFPTMGMLSKEHEKYLNDAVDGGDAGDDDCRRAVVPRGWCGERPPERRARARCSR